MTLTFGTSGVYEREQAAKLVMRFLQRHPQGWMRKRYLLVYELHVSHGWHVHLLCQSAIPVVRLRLSWTSFLGYHGITSRTGLVRIHAKRFDSPRAAGTYAGKYVSKDFDQESDAKGRHRYARGECIEDPSTTRLTCAAIDLGDVKRELHLLGVPEDAKCYVVPDSEFPIVVYEWDAVEEQKR